jgi:hypothetical protein
MTCRYAINCTRVLSKLILRKNEYFVSHFTTTEPIIHGCSSHMYLYVPAFWKVTLNVFEEPGNVFS